MYDSHPQQEEDKVIPPRQIRLAQYAAYLLIVGTLLLAGKTLWFITTAETVKGHIIAITESRNCDQKEDACYRPVFRFYDEERPGWFHKYELKANFSSGNHNLYHVGEEVEVLYPKQEPHEARIKGFLTLWMTSLVMSVIAFILSAVTLAAASGAEDDITPTVLSSLHKRILKLSLLLPVVIGSLAAALTYL